MASLSSERFWSGKYSLRNGLWHPLNIPLPRAPSKRELQQGCGPAGCAVLLKARFDRRFYLCQGSDLGGEEGREADRASAMLEPAARRGAGGSSTFEECQGLVEEIFRLLGFRGVPMPAVRGKTTALPSAFHNSKCIVC